MNTEQLTNIKIENILEMFIIYLKDRFNEVNHINHKDNEEFDYEYVEDNQAHYGDIELYDNALKKYAYDHSHHSQGYLTYCLYKKEGYIYFKELVDDNFDNRYINECYYYIVDILEKYRGLTDNEYFENYWDNMLLNEIGDEGEENYINIESNNCFKFWLNIEEYFQIILDEDYELNKIDFVESIIDSLNNPPVCLK